RTRPSCCACAASGQTRALPSTARHFRRPTSGSIPGPPAALVCSDTIPLIDTSFLRIMQHDRVHRDASSTIGSLLAVVLEPAPEEGEQQTDDARRKGGAEDAQYFNIGAVEPIARHKRL